MLRICAVTMTLLAVTVLPGAAARANWADNADVPSPRAYLQNNRTIGDEFFHVEWAAAAGRRGQARITGYVYNDHGEAAVNVQLRITALDSTGQAVDTVVEPVRGTVPGFSRAYFDVPVPAGPSYQVSVMSFDFMGLGKS